MSNYSLLQIKQQNEKALARIQKANLLCEKYQTLEDINSLEDFLQIISSLSTQAKAPLVEKFLAKRNSWKKLSPSQEKGDFIDKDGNYIELKVSFHNKEEKLNLRQVRLYQNIDKYICYYFDDMEKLQDNSKCFILSKEEMEQEVKSAGSFTHGTKRANQENKNVEYSITIPMKDNTHPWLTKYQKTINWSD